MFSPNTPVSSINKTANQDIYTLCAYCVGATVCIVSSQLCKPDHYETQCRVMMWFTKLSRYGTNNCTNTFMHIIRLSNIFLGQKRIILLDFIIIPSPTKLRRDSNATFRNILVNTLESTSFNRF